MTSSNDAFGAFRERPAMQKAIQDAETSVTSFSQDSKVCMMFSGLDYDNFVHQYLNTMKINDPNTAKETLIIGTLEYAMRSTFPELFEHDEPQDEESKKKPDAPKAASRPEEVD